MRRKILSILLIVAMIFGMSTTTAAAYNPDAEVAYLESLGYENVIYISKVDPGDGLYDYIVKVPEGANIALVKAGSGPIEFKVFEITEDMFVDEFGNPYVEGDKYFIVDSEGLLNNGGQQPAISHISFFKADAYFYLEKIWKDAEGSVIEDTDLITQLNSELVFSGGYKLGKNLVPYFGEYTVSEESIPDGYFMEVGEVTIIVSLYNMLNDKVTGTFINYAEPITPYSIISGFKLDAKQMGSGLGFMDVSFDFEIYSIVDDVETLVAIAKSEMDGTGMLKFQWIDDTEWLDAIELEEGTYKIVELSKTGYEFVKTIVYDGINEPVEGISPSITFVSGDIETFSFEFYNQKQIVYKYETAYAFNGSNVGGTLNSIRGQNNWGWYIGVNESTTSNVYDIYAGAGQNNIAKGTKVGTVSFVIVGDYYQPVIALNPGILQQELHFGVYKKLTDIPKGPGLFTNLVKVADAKYLVLHLVVGIPQE